jgi:hypothetical protein
MATFTATERNVMNAPSCDKHALFTESCRACQDAFHHEIRSKPLVLAGQHEVEIYQQEIQELLDLIGHSEALVTDLSSLWDFNLKPSNYDQIEEHFGITVEKNAYLVSIASQIREKRRKT